MIIYCFTFYSKTFLLSGDYINIPGEGLHKLGINMLGYKDP
jgi:hypothetical protein